MVFFQRCIALALCIAVAHALIAVGHRCPLNARFSRDAVISLSSAEPIDAPDDDNGFHYAGAEDSAVAANAAEICSALLQPIDHSAAPSSALFAACLDVADELLARGLPSDAQGCWQTCLELDPVNTFVAERLAVCLRLLDRPQAAANVLHGCLAVNGFAGGDLAVARALLNGNESKSNTNGVGDVKGGALRGNGNDGGFALAQAGGLYLDLGEAVDALAPAPGTGASWPLASDRVGELCAPIQAVEVGCGDTTEALSSLQCFERAAALSDLVVAGSTGVGFGFGEKGSTAPGDDACASTGDFSCADGAAYVSGVARKRLAQGLVARRGAAVAQAAFLQAAASLPLDICCATHVFYGAPAITALPPPPPPPPPNTAAAAAAAVPSLAALQVNAFVSDGSAGGSVGSGGARSKRLDAPAAAAGEEEEGAGLENQKGKCEDNVWSEVAASVFECEGAVVLPGFLQADELATLETALAARLGGGRGGGLRQVLSDGDRELTALTRAPRGRTHGALPLEGPAALALARITRRLWPLLAAVLRTDEPRTAVDKPTSGDKPSSGGSGGGGGGGGAHAVLLGSGFMTVGPGSGAQELHNDVHGVDRHSLKPPGSSSGDGVAPPPGGPRVVSLQLQLTDTRRSARAKKGAAANDNNDDDDDDDGSSCVGGSLELLPGSHRPDAHHGLPSQIVRAGLDDSGVVSVEVGAGCATLYSSRLWHGGGANVHGAERRFVFLTLGEAGAPAPPGLIHTMARRDVGAWVVGGSGLRQRDGGAARAHES